MEDSSLFQQKFYWTIRVSYKMPRTSNIGMVWQIAFEDMQRRHWGQICWHAEHGCFYDAFWLNLILFQYFKHLFYLLFLSHWCVPLFLCLFAMFCFYMFACPCLFMMLCFICLCMFLSSTCLDIVSDYKNKDDQSIHYSDGIMGAMASQTTSLTFVYSTVHAGADQRKHQSSASQAFVRGIHRWPVIFPHKWPVTRKMFPFDDVIMIEFQVFFDGDTNHLETILWRNNSVTDRRQFHCGPVTPNGGKDLGQHWFR